MQMRLCSCCAAWLLASRPRISCWSVTWGWAPDLKHCFLFLVAATKVKIVESVESIVNKP